jgi:hypothetical protein
MSFQKNTHDTIIVLPDDLAQGFRLNCYDPKVLEGFVTEQ